MTMTLPVACPPSTSCADPPTVPQRKRRRRAPATGASDDCFACTKRNLKCDRRRPYCSQCLEYGKECSGYKTQLTWGVGVASRGKLRGLSLPIARSAPAPKSPPPIRPRAATTISRARAAKDEGIRIKMETMPSLPVNSFMTYDFVNMAPNGTAPPHQVPDWNMSVSTDYPMQQEYQQPDGMSRQRPMPQLHRLHTLSLGRVEHLAMPSSPLDPLSPYTDSDFPSPVSHSFSNGESPFLHSPLPIYGSNNNNHNNNTYSSSNSTAGHSPRSGMMGDLRGPTSCPDQYYAQSDISSSISSVQTLYDIAESRQQHGSPTIHEIFYDDDLLGLSNRDSDVFASSAGSGPFGGWTSINDEDVSCQKASTMEAYNFNGPEHMSSLPDMTPRISFFLDYYERIICPSVVIIDSPSNPYREHILSLASSSQSLQHAICALSACNLRMKRKQALNQDHWRQPVELELMDRINGGSFGRPVCSRRTTSTHQAADALNQDSSLQEEYQHRSLAVSLLNQQLGDPSKACHDCVLATLFILCHYRMCESGIARFRTQFAGVKKILGMRESGIETRNWGWIESMFTYFDGMAASINDREAQLRGGYLEMLALPSNPNHSLENIAGCDPILFKSIAKLGRLNLLSQHRFVMPDSVSFQRPPSQSVGPPAARPHLTGQALADFYALHAHNFDGNSFAHTLDDEPFFQMQNLPSPSGKDGQQSFWSEWKAMRAALQSWEFDPVRVAASLPLPPTALQLRDFGYISEAFRYSALLYTERLANPKLPSSHLSFQNLVSQVLYYVTSLDADGGAAKFLLWPLFMAGSECVNELQQSIVRGKCREISARSGYVNGLAGLDVLEKGWKEGDGREGGRGWLMGPFSWTRHMDGGEGEWIMA